MPVQELALAMLADKLALEISWKLPHKLAPDGLSKISLQLCKLAVITCYKLAAFGLSKCYKLAVIMFHDDSEENRFCLTTRGAGVNWVPKVPKAIYE